MQTALLPSLRCSLHFLTRRRRRKGAILFYSIISEKGLYRRHMLKWNPALLNDDVKFVIVTCLWFSTICCRLSTRYLKWTSCMKKGFDPGCMRCIFNDRDKPTLWYILNSSLHPEKNNDLAEEHCPGYFGSVLNYLWAKSCNIHKST